MHTTLIEPEELAAPLARNARPDSDGNGRRWVIIDCRFDLARPQWGAAAYAAGHIPGALYAHLDHDLSGPISPTSGRHPLPSLARLAETFDRWGINEKVQVVAYDQGNGVYAARLWWLLRWAGHRPVAVLNGGFAAWQQAALPVETAPIDITAARTSGQAFIPHPIEGAVVSTAELERALSAGELEGGASMLVDARSADRFAGQNETIDPVAGHIPGAHDHPFLGNVDARGRFLPASELRKRWQAALGDRAAARVISMCGSGVTACHNLLALEIAGLPGARLYAGSWSEWIRDPGRPVARGAPSET